MTHTVLTVILGGLLVGFLVQLNAIASLFLLREFKKVQKVIKETDTIYLEDSNDLFSFIEEQ